MKLIQRLKEIWINKPTPPFEGKLVYRFIDSSVPPEYHRSFTIRVTPGSAKVTVDSYGTILKEYTANLTQENFQKLILELKETHITKNQLTEENGCAGGTTDRFDIALDNFIICGYVYHCAGKMYGDLVGDTDKVAGLFGGLVPGLLKIVKRV